MEFVLGVDGGATKTIFYLTDIDGKFITEYNVGPTNYKAIGVEKTKRNIIKGIKELSRFTKKIKSACFGFSGMDSCLDRETYLKIILNNDIKILIDFENILILNDTNIGLAAGSENVNRIGLVCGTGSNCYGINQDGNEARVDGLDYILGDEGSGYTQGVRALRAAAKSFDGRGPATLLENTIFDHLNIKNNEELMTWTYSGFSKDRIAAISRILVKTANMGDKVSIQILEEEAHNAAWMVHTIAIKLGLENKKFDLVLIGNTFNNKIFFTNKIKKELENEFPKIIIKALTKKPVLGAIKLAINLL